MSVFSGGNEPWQIEFEKEEINDGRWSCIVSAIVESEPNDEEYLKILDQHVTTGEIPLVRILTMTDVIALFKTPTDGKKKDESKVKEKMKRESANDPSLLARRPPPRFPEIVPFLSKYIIISDGSCKLAPELMAYALKYLILNLKDQDYCQRRVARNYRRQTEEARVRAEVIETLKGCRQKRVIPKDEEKSNFWGRNRFDIFSDSFKDGPFHGPELYVVLHDFYDPLVFPELLKLKVPFLAVTKIENLQSNGRKPVTGATLKKSEIINNFWKLLEGNVSDEIALLKYVAPDFDSKKTAEISSTIATGLTAVLYSIFNVHRLHQTYIQQMKVNRMIESLELLNLSKCAVYNELCDALITENMNAEILVLFSMIEQVVAGVPETENRVLGYENKTSIFFEQNEDLVSVNTPISGEYCEPEKSHREQGVPGVSGRIFFHDDKISLGTISPDSNILQMNEIFDRLVINSISSIIRNKFAKRTPAVKAQNDFSFYQMWHNSKENIDNFRVKMFFLIAMRMFERIKIVDIDCGSVSSHCESMQTANENSISTGEESQIRNESQESPYFDIENLFYQQCQLPKKIMKSSSVATKEVRKAEAISSLDKRSSLSSENEEIACGICPKLTVNENSTARQVQMEKLEKFLESYEISHLNDPNLLANRTKCDAFVEKHNFYETFEPNRTVQRLQELFDEFNTVEYTYFSPTDTLFVLGHHDSDFRGVYHSLESGFINSPLRLRDFVRYVLPDNKIWMANINAKYIEFLRGVRMRIWDEKKRRNHDIRCGLLKMYKGMTDSERRRFLDDPPAQGKGTESGNKKGTMESRSEISVVDLEDLPEKERQRQPGVEIFGVNCGGTRTQVNVVNYEFHCEDGSVVGAKTRSWLYSESIVTFIATRRNCRLFVHRWLEEKEKRMMLFREPSGILVTFGLETRPFPVKITQPNGLMIEIGNGTSHIKQTYLEPYKWGEDIAKEKSRCYLRDGSVLIFYIDGTINVLCPSGTKHSCFRMTSKGEVEVYETLSPTGELWVRDDCSKCKHSEKMMTVMVGVDSEIEETYYKREDGTSCMLWPNGKLVTIYPEGTKITTTPKFEEELLVIETEEESSITSKTAGSRSTMNGDSLEEVNNGFTVITCSYLIEHPKYATVYSEQPKLEVRILENMKAEMNSKECIRIECRHSVLKVSAENAEFYTVCKHCGKRSTSKIFLNSEILLSKSKDYNGHRFYVYNSGQVLYKSENENSDNEELLARMEDPKNVFLGTPTGHCEFHKNCRFLQRCLIVERDLTGMEFIHDDNLLRFHGSLSQDAYYHVGNLSVDKTHIQHGFFDPVYRIGREKYLMKYEKDDGLPTRLTRKNLKSGGTINSKTGPVQRQTRDLPKAVVVRFIRVLLPDPKTVMKEITKEIAIYRRRSLDLSKNYEQLSKNVKRSPFTKYIAKELELISSTLCPSLKLYPHTSSLVPYSEKEIHSAAHCFDRNNYLVESNPADWQAEILPRCKRIPKPLKHSGKDADIPEVVDHDDE